MWSDTLSSAEVEATQRAIDRLAEISWAAALRARLESAGGFSSANKPLMFEVRYADALHLAGVRANYEQPAESLPSTVDFEVLCTPSWLVECVSIRASEAAQQAVRQVGMIYTQSLSSIAHDQRQSPQGEMIIAEQKIAEKVYRDDRATKFPLPKSDRFHMILVDSRGYLDGGGDVFDYRQMAYGWQGIPAGEDWLIHWWRDEATGEWSPVKGLFEPANPIVGATYVRDRIHFLGFVREEDYKPHEIQRRCYVLANPSLFDEAEALKAWETYPLKPDKRNGG